MIWIDLNWSRPQENLIKIKYFALQSAKFLAYFWKFPYNNHTYNELILVGTFPVQATIHVDITIGCYSKFSITSNYSIPKLGICSLKRWRIAIEIRNAKVYSNFSSLQPQLIKIFKWHYHPFLFCFKTPNPWHSKNIESRTRNAIK